MDKAGIDDVDDRPKSDDEAFEKILDDAEMNAMLRVFRYVAIDRFSSFIVWFIWMGSWAATKKLFDLWSKSGGPAELAQLPAFDRKMTST